MSDETTSDLKKTPLFALHEELGGKMVPFAGYLMPVQYPMGIMGEHKHTRAKAGLFDVSHMGQVILTGESYAAVAEAFERLVPMDVLGLKEGRQRYGLFTNDQGGIEDDLMFANRGDHLFVVVNAACKEADIARMKAALEPAVTVTPIIDRALLALQGPAAEAVLSAIAPAAADMKFMDVATLDADGVEIWVSRSGYTGEDGYEISVPANQAEAFARRLLARADVEPIGLGARDSLRLEGGLCLYGHDIDAETRPAAASLTWAIQKVRRPGGDREGGFPGAAHVFAEMAEGSAMRRVGLKPEGRAPMREGVELFAEPEGGAPIGKITSGGFGPTEGGPVAMGYVPADMATPGTRIYGELRGKRAPVTVATLPFVAANFKR
ncbi:MULTISPECIES: glycine cleavage system aminomethyltransferase GcvT [Rhodobacterales]|jgi:aminomethyltransferase|uniref:glycine cleavage system aminomethyltransferase GcvT n=1 Tax=Rhodobacterales TaxID=204455 RepID=UPI00237FB751|nr:glycine cleavage system aminomethyltransferase GcvT [Phaeobacter gallaeciensis]MDE4139089.1 glycine cleavage system aminomethyltransferase GcvT [Phaeobacter gallaeciensis]MDE4147853.1 glycine cleavage system aminomethyltransferase GcvT [Phaeobacter gallaeciensis]MDE4152071.1 glycine cleavage system aminomethyltransferase GcvT [Phaeobacter gallaeciensis]MDE4227145.1 glycine cleavage system aminomethyltransferase GcvT [Phaeobacter gallaeciensis]MDE4256535.1 glycine cleavage system aminomethyl